jgi:ABC-type nitrate/sulfonate/bicarbonate transport system permease component
MEPSEIADAAPPMRSGRATDLFDRVEAPTSSNEPKDTQLPTEQAPVPTPVSVVRRRGVIVALLQTRLAGILLIVVLFGLWQLLTATHVYESPNVPPLSQILDRWYHDLRSGPLLSDLGVMLQTTAIGFALAVVVGTVLGVLMARVRFIWALLEPTIELLRPIPIAAFIPILVLFLGIEDKMKIGAIFFAGIFPVLLNSYAGAASVSASMRDTAKTFRLSWFQTTRKVILPAAAPQIFVGMRVSLSICLIIAVVAEMIAGNNGIGYFVLNSEEMFDIKDMYVGIFTLAIVGYALNFIFLLIEKTVLGWHYGNLNRNSA